MITLWADMPLEVIDAIVIFMYSYKGAYTAYEIRETSLLLKGRVRNVYKLMFIIAILHDTNEAKKYQRLILS